MIRRLWLGVLQNTQFVVTTLTVLAILRIRTAHSLYFGAGTLVAAFSGTNGSFFRSATLSDGTNHLPARSQASEEVY